MRSIFGVLLILVVASGAHAQQWNWLSPLPCGNSLNKVVAFSETHCLIFGDMSTVMLTTDGGQHWSLGPGGLGSNLVDAFFTDSLHGWVVGGLGG